MFGDIGHGICLMGAGVLGAFMFRKNPGTRSFSWLIFYCGIGAALGGFMYGEAFGHHYFIKETIELHPWLVNPMEEGGVMVIVKMSIIVGVVVLSVGYIIRGINYVINKKKYLAFSECVFKILLLIGGTIVILKYGFTIGDWFAPPYPVLMVIIPALLIIILQILGKAARLTSYLKKKTYGEIIGHSTLDLAETFLAIISNIASFIRILALEMAHIGLMLVFSKIGEVIGNDTVFRAIMMFIIVLIGNIFVIALETLLVIIHGMRLHFYEFFSKFYVADGYEFRLIEIDDEYSNLIFETTSEIQTPFLYRRNR